MQQRRIRIIHRYNTAAVWASYNPILLTGEIGIESDTASLKVGDGATAWTDLPYFVQAGASSEQVLGNTIVIDGQQRPSAALQYDVVGG